MPIKPEFKSRRYTYAPLVAAGRASGHNCCLLCVSRSPTSVGTSKPLSKESTAVRFNGNFPGGAGLAGTRMSLFWILLELRMMEVVSGDNWSCKTCKAPVRSSSPTNQHIDVELGRQQR